MQQEHWLYVALAVLVVAFVLAWRAARARRRRARLKKAMRGVSASHASSTMRTRNGSLRSDMRWAESKGDVMEQMAKPVTGSNRQGPASRSRRDAA